MYDKDGNMTYGPLNGKMTEFVFDCRNRLVKAGDTSYKYDAENNRVAMVTDNKRIEYVVDSQPELSQVLQSTTYDIATENQQGEMTYYFYGKGLLAQDNQEVYLTYHFNNVGSTMAVTDVKGRVTETYNYTPYGELIDGTYSDNIPFLYNGQYGVTTDGNGLYYMRARYYNVDVKGFVNQDVLTGTLERISSLIRYAYVEGNPVSYLDPFGLARSIYDEWHDQINQILEVMTVESLIANMLFMIPPLGWGVGLGEIWVYFVDLGVAIGRAWEGIFENDYAKVDSSYQMMNEILNNLALTLSNMALSWLTGSNVFGGISDFINIVISQSKHLQQNNDG